MWAVFSFGGGEGLLGDGGEMGWNDSVSEAVVDSAIWTPSSSSSILCAEGEMGEEATSAALSQGHLNEIAGPDCAVEYIQETGTRTCD